MRPLRLATWNIEWMTNLFDRHDRLIEDDSPSSRYKVSKAEQITAIGIVLTAIDADGIMIIEGPDTGSQRDTVQALEHLARRLGLRTTRAVHGFSSETEQEIAFLYDPDRLTARHDPRGKPAVSAGGYGAPRFDTALRIDLDEDGAAELVRFSKPPLELQVDHRGHALRLIGIHAKSKSPHGARDEADAIRIAISNRRKQLAECLWARARVQDHLARGETVIVLGDLNDGPGLDEFEQLFGQSGVEVLLGTDQPPGMRLYDPHALNESGRAETTARFWIQPRQDWLEALLDFIMVPQALAPRADWRIWHPLRDNRLATAPELVEALLQASDHFPVTCDLRLDD